MTEEKIPLELIDEVRAAIQTLIEFGLIEEERVPYYEGWQACLTWVRARLYGKVP